MRALVLLSSIVLASAIPRPASAQSAAAAGPDTLLRAPRAFQAPTAWLRDRNTVHATAGYGYNAGPFAAVTAGLGSVADLDVTVDELTGDTRPSVLFKMATPRTWPVGAALGFRKSFTGTLTAQGFLAASADLRQVRLHAGLEMWATQDRLLDGKLAGLRPFGAVEWTPPMFPRSTILSDLVWAPRPETTLLVWVWTSGVRYRFVDWGSVELAVQFNEHDLLHKPAIFVRLNASYAR